MRNGDVMPPRTDTTPVDIHPQMNFPVTNPRFVPADHVGHEAKSLLESRRSFRDHRGVKSNTDANGESAAVTQPPEIHCRAVALKEHRYRARRIERDAESARNDIGGGTRQHSHPRALVSE